MNKKFPTSKAEYVQENGYVVHVVRTRRKKSASIKIEQGVLSILVPQDLSMDRIHQMIASKHQWITAKLGKMTKTPSIAEKSFAQRKEYLFLGQQYSLKLSQGKPSVRLEDGSLKLSLLENEPSFESIKKAITRWYNRQADQIFHEKVRFFEPKVGVETGAVRIKSFKSRWGSCTSNDDLEFNWQLVLAPEPVIDYVIVHELCHLIHFDHSPAFWQEVEKVIPDHKECRHWLKINGQALTI